MDVSDGGGGGLLVFNCENSCNNCPIVTGWSSMIMVSFDSICFPFQVRFNFPVNDDAA